MDAVTTSIDLDDRPYQQAAKRVVEANKQIVDATNKVGESQTKMVPSVGRAAESFDRLKRTLDPVYDAQKKIEKATRDADAAIAAGRASVADKATVLGKLTAQLTPATGGMRSLSTISDELKTRLAGLGGELGMAGSALQALGTKGMVAAGVIGTMVAALVTIARHAHEAMTAFDALGDSAARLGISAEFLQQLSYGFNQAGVKTEQLETALTKLNGALGAVIDKGADAPTETLDALAKLGITINDVSVAGGNLNVLLPKMADGMANLKTQAERVNVAKALMGKTAAGLVPVLMQGAGALDSMAKSASNAGAVLGEALTKQLGDANDKLDALDQTLTVQNARAFGQFADQLVQTKQYWVNFVTALNDWGDWLDRQNWGGRIISWLDTIIAKTSQVKQLGASGSWGPGSASGGWGGVVPPANSTPVGVSTQLAGPGGLLLTTPTPAGSGGGGRGGGGSGVSQEEREIAAVEKLREAWLRSNGDIIESLQARWMNELRVADNTIKDAGRLAEAKQLINDTYYAEEQKAIAERDQRLAETAKEFAEQMAAIDQEIANERIASLRASGQEQLALALELQEKLGKIETNGGTIEQQQALINFAQEKAMQDAGKLGDERAAALKKQQEDALFSTKNVTQAANDLGLSFSSAFENAIQGGGKLKDVLGGLVADMQKIMLRNLVTKPLEGALSQATSALGPMLSRMFSPKVDKPTEDISKLTIGDVNNNASLNAQPGSSGIGAWLSSQTDSLASWADDLFGGGKDAAAATADAAAASKDAAGAVAAGGTAMADTGRSLPQVIGGALGGLVNGLLGMFGGGSGGTDWAGSIVGLAYGAVSTYFTGQAAGAAGASPGYGTTGNPTANVGAMTSGGTNPGFLLGGAAHGGVFDMGNVIPFARGGVVHRPTLFPMARGAGLMGEAGPEGVLPLRRTASGDLGVIASSGGSKVTVNVINNAGAKVSTKQDKDENGDVQINVIIDAVEQAMAQRAARPGTTLNRALSAAANPVRAR